MDLNKHVLFITSEFPPQPGGIGNHAYNLGLALQKEGRQVTVISDIRSQDGIAEREFDAQLPFSVQRVKRRKLIWFSYLDRFIKAKKQIKNTNCVIASGKFSLWVVFFLKLFYNKKYIAIVHGSEVLLANRFLRKFIDASLKKFDGIVAVSQFTKSLLNGMSLKHVEVIPNGFTIPKNLRATERPQTTAPLNLITVGNVTQRKGQHNVIKTLPLLLEKYPDLQYHIVGIPTEKERILALAETLGVVKHITFYGKVGEVEKWKLLGSATIFIMLSEATSYGDVEGFGIAVLEANALGIPAIGAKGCGIEDAIAHKESGMLVAAQDASAVVEAVNEINTAYGEFSKNALKWSEHFSWNKIVKQYLEVIDK